MTHPPGVPAQKLARPLIGQNVQNRGNERGERVGACSNVFTWKFG